jgi:hypothetical protein
MLVNARELQVAGYADLGSGSIWGIAVTGTDVYYTIEGELPGGVTAALMRVPLGGGLSTPVTTGSFAGAVITGTQLVFVRQGSGTENDIMTIPLAGGPPTQVGTFSLNPDVFMTGFTADDNFVYYTTSNGVYAVPLNPDAGSAGVIPITTQLPPDHQNPEGLGLFGNQLIFGWSNGGIESVPLPPQANAPVTTLNAGHDESLYVTLCGSTSCWLGWEDYGFEKIDSTGKSLATLSIDSLPWLYHWEYAAFDGTSFFLAGNGPLRYVNLRAGFLARVAASDGTVTMLGGMEFAQDVAVDDECVYWASASGLFSLSKTTTQTFTLDGVPLPPAGDAGVSTGPSVTAGADGGACYFEASNYDQSCVADGDCVEVFSTDYCSNTKCFCSGDPISVTGRAQFNADIAKTPLGSGALQVPPCSCPTPAPPPCCRAGMCTRGC